MGGVWGRIVATRARADLAMEEPEFISLTRAEVDALAVEIGKPATLPMVVMGMQVILAPHQPTST